MPILDWFRSCCKKKRKLKVYPMHSMDVQVSRTPSVPSVHSLVVYYESQPLPIPTHHRGDTQIDIHEALQSTPRPAFVEPIPKNS